MEKLLKIKLYNVTVGEIIASAHIDGILDSNRLSQSFLLDKQRMARMTMMNRIARIVIIIVITLTKSLWLNVCSTVTCNESAILPLSGINALAL